MATIADNLQTIIDIKADIKTAIINKGVDVADDDGFATYPDKISQIQGGGSDVVLINGYIDTNGTYTAGYDGNNWDGWSSITVDVETSSTGGAFKVPNGLKFAYSTILTLPDLDFSDVSDFERMFFNCYNLTNIQSINVTNAIVMSNMFYGCNYLTELCDLYCPMCTNFHYIFYDCALVNCPNITTQSATDVSGMFLNCISLVSIPLLDFSNVETINSMFNLLNNVNTLTTLGGFKDLKIDWNDSGGLTRCPNLTYESVMNVINNLYDFRNNGDMETTRTIRFNSNSIALLSEADIAIATNKGWNITA